KTGSDDNVLVARKSANGEISSIILQETASIISTLPHIAKTAEGKPISSGETVVVINLQKIEGNGVSNVTVRGVSDQVFTLRPHVQLVEGRMFSFGKRELIVGSSINKRFIGAKIGDKVRFAGDDWTIVGKFDTDGSGFDSEIWGDTQQLQDAFSRQGGYSTYTFKLDNKENFNDFKAAFDKEPRLQQFEPKIEQRFFEEQSEAMATFIRILGIFVTVIFSLGATIGAMITMYSAVANRTVEIGTLRALGFHRRSILFAFMAESLLLSLVGGVCGLFLASFLQFFKISTLNFTSFSELEFSFAISPDIIVTSLIFAVFMGIVGGFLPAVRAARLNIITALRAS
ncbi:MAG: FtsX-like permease family protein, partial [Bacteroidota bacterium]|nr:FtsX-like permease family protein [Bacteroidota bacterium]